MKSNRNECNGAPLPLAPRLFVSLLLLACAALLWAPGLLAEGPVQPVAGVLTKARKALAAGDQKEALANGIAALRQQPLGGAENLQMCLTMFWLARFDDSARYMRRALAASPDCLRESAVAAEDRPADGPETGARLSARIPSARVAGRLNELALLSKENADLCFLTGALLLINEDHRRAFAYLLRAEELAGSDGQATALMNDLGQDPQPDRSQTRAMNAIQRGDFRDGLRSFAFAAMDRPSSGVHYAGMALCLAAQAELDDEGIGAALAFIELMQAHATTQQLLKWWHRAEPKPDRLVQAALVIETPAEAEQPVPIARLQLAMLLYFGAGYYASAEETSVAILMQYRLHDLTAELRQYMYEHELKYDPASVEPPKATPSPDPQPDSAEAVRQARKHLRQGEYTKAMDRLSPLVVEELEEPAVFYLLFVTLVGRGELKASEMALTAWLLRVEDEQRLRLNALRELFELTATYDRWKKIIDDAVANAPQDWIAATIRCYVRLSEGRYDDARLDLIVATLQQVKAGPSITILDRLLATAETAEDSRPDVPKAADPKTLFDAAEKRFADKDYQVAKSLYLEAAEGDAGLPKIGLALFRVWFALGNSQQAAAQLLLLLEEQGIAKGSARDFQFRVSAGYKEAAEFSKHLEALSEECKQHELNTESWLVLGAIEFGRGEYAEAAKALKFWSENQTGERNAGALKLLAYAAKNKR